MGRVSWRVLCGCIIMVDGVWYLELCVVCLRWVRWGGGLGDGEFGKRDGWGGGMV